MKHLHVACAIIEKQEWVLATQRSVRMSLPLKWEFPGGKIKPGESPQECLRREVAEELGLDIVVERALPLHTHTYEDFTVTLYPFVATIHSGLLTLHEHAACEWILPEKLGLLDWAEADIPVIRDYLAASA